MQMNYKTFDTHKHIKSLQETGFNEKQAEIIIKSLIESRDFDLSFLATREQVTKAESNVQGEIIKLDAKIDKVESNLQGEIIKLDAKIDKVESNLDAKIDKVESNLDAKIDKVESNLQGQIIKLDAKIDKVEANLQGQIIKLDSKIDVVYKNMIAEISNIKYDMLKWIIPLIFTIIAMMIAIMIKLF